MMAILPYKAHHHAACMAIFDSNCPHYFDPRERSLFDNWLNHLEGVGDPKTPAAMVPVRHAEYMVMPEGEGVVACGGFYVPKEADEGRLAWGMVARAHHNKGYGTRLFEMRKEAILGDWPGCTVTLGTSQHTYPFYARMGMRVVHHVPKGYGPHLDRYDMVFAT